MTGIDFNPSSRVFAQDPYAVYGQLRQLDEPFWYPDMEILLLSRYEVVDRVARDPHMVRGVDSFMSEEAQLAGQRARNWHDMPNHERFIQFSMLEIDGEDHRRLRGLVLREFSKTLIEKQREMIQDHVDHLLDSLLEQGDIDFVNDFAVKVPGYVIGQVLGVPAEDAVQLRTWSEEIVQFFDVGRTESDKAVAEAAVTAFYEYLLPQIRDRQKQPRDDLLTVLVQAHADGQLSETELVSTTMLILAGGHGSTIDVLGNGMNALFSFPDEMQRLRRSPDLVQTAVHEMFRYDSPLPFFHRFADREVEVMGCAYPIGTKFGLLYGSANRDPDYYPDADRFDIGRTPNRHLGFGRGAHLCLGNNLARLDMEIIFTTLFRRTRAIERIIDEPLYRTGLSARGLEALQVRLVPA